jgi:hypothetical protein
MRKKVDSISDSRVVQKAIEKRLESLPHNFQKIIVDRDDVAIIAYIESQSSISSNINENFKVKYHRYCRILKMIMFLGCRSSADDAE